MTKVQVTRAARQAGKSAAMSMAYGGAKTSRMSHHMQNVAIDNVLNDMVKKIDYWNNPGVEPKVSGQRYLCRSCGRPHRKSGDRKGAFKQGRERWCCSNPGLEHQRFADQRKAKHNLKMQFDPAYKGGNHLDLEGYDERLRSVVWP